MCLGIAEKYRIIYFPYLLNSLQYFIASLLGANANKVKENKMGGVLPRMRKRELHARFWL
jgi:hypothetical protein